MATGTKTETTKQTKTSTVTSAGVPQTTSKPAVKAPSSSPAPSQKDMTAAVPKPKPVTKETQKRKKFHLRHFLTSKGWMALCGSFITVFLLIGMIGELYADPTMLELAKNGTLTGIGMLLLPSPVFAITDKITESFKEAIF